MADPPNVTELEFVFDGGEFVLGRAGAAAGAELEAKLIVPRSDGAVLAFVEAGGDVADVLDALRHEEKVREATRLDRPDDSPLVQLVMDGHPVTTLADRGAVVTQLSATERWGRVVADVPPPVDAGPVIAAFTLAHPTARLVGRRETDRPVPLLGQSQFVTQVLGRFTERQLNALRVAFDHGYFEWPRDTKADDVAAAIGVSTPTFSQHIRAAERKLTELLFEG